MTEKCENARTDTRRTQPSDDRVKDWGDGILKPRNAWAYQKLEEARRVWKDPDPDNTLVLDVKPPELWWIGGLKSLSNKPSVSQLTTSRARVCSTSQLTNGSSVMLESGVVLYSFNPVYRLKNLGLMGDNFQGWSQGMSRNHWGVLFSVHSESIILQS